MVGLLSGLFNVTVCVVFPIAIFLIILTRSKNAKTELKVFLVGVCTYLVAQILFRQPAAIAEEIGRYIAFRFFVKGQSAQNTPLYFGLGHGGIEALSVGVNSVILLVCSPYTLINMGSDVALAGIERISTLLAQIAFSYIVFCSYQKKTYRYLILAICLHSMYDFPLVLLDYSVSPFIFEIGLFLFSAILLLFTLKGVRGIHSNEKNN